jgi:hypothetical protein
MYDNAKPHTAVSIKQFLEKQWIPELNRPPHSLIYPHQALSYPSKSNPRWKAEYLKTWRTLKELQQENCWHYMQMRSQIVSSNFMSEALSRV